MGGSLGAKDTKASHQCRENDTTPLTKQRQRETCTLASPLLAPLISQRCFPWPSLAGRRRAESLGTAVCRRGAVAQARAPTMPSTLP